MHILLIALIACKTDPKDPADDTDTTDPCDACDADATCEGTGAAATCVCNDGFTGDGTTCDDIDECATDNGGCDLNATCDNNDGGYTCTCIWGYEGDGETCTVWIDAERRACAVQEAEHPGYTNIARDVALCGSQYDTTNITTACHTGWHVCLEGEWMARYPTNRPYKTSPTDPDLIGPTLGQRTSWGALQSERCGGGVWQDRQTESAETWSGSVCHYADDGPGNDSGADYLPYNDGKFLLADDGTTVLQGHNAEGEPDCCSWDVTFAATATVDDFAVYCCLDAQ